MNRIGIICAIGAVVVLLGSGTAGHADARDDKARVDRQLQETQATLEAATDRAQQVAADHAAATAALPGAQDALEDAKGRVIAAEAAARQAQRDRDAADAVVEAADAEYDGAKAQVEQGRDDVSAFVAAAYKGSGFAMFNSILESGSPNDLALRISYLDRVAAESQRALDELTIARMSAKQRSGAAELARDKARQAAEQTRQALQDSMAAQAGAEQAAADVKTLIDKSAQAEAVASSERTAVLARYQQLKVDSDRIAGELRAEAAAEAAAAAKAARAAGRPAASGAQLTTAIPPSSGAFFLMPVHGWKSSNYGMRFDPVYKVYQLHAGIDVAAGAGSRSSPPPTARWCGPAGPVATATTPASPTASTRARDSPPATATSPRSWSRSARPSAAASSSAGSAPPALPPATTCTSRSGSTAARSSR
ncbi:hypothetical protein GCM10027610_108630 [Dactylosporangium cerinum]